MPHSTPLAAIAAHEGLHYISDARPGFTRQRRGKAFIFFDQHGAKISDADTIQRIRSLAIPPAYTNVWISPKANGHIQATGIDARGRKQYRYHVKWRAVRDKDKFSHILSFGAALPHIRRKISQHLKRKELSREKVLATLVMLLEKTLIRIGNAEYAKQNSSYGLTTLRKKHIDIEGADLHFHFKGKSGKDWDLCLHDRQLAGIVKKCSELPGYELFKFQDSQGRLHEITSSDVNHYLQDLTGEDFTAKDFRTWSGTVLAALALREFKKYDSQAQAKKNVVAAIERVSKQLGNTPSICRKCYVHPEIINSYMSGELAKMIKDRIDEKFKKDLRHLSEDEIMVLAFLHRRLKVRSRPSAKT